MKTRGAVLLAAPGRYETAELDLDDPRDDEVLVKVAASGMCHSDDHVATGDLPAVLPICGGHEGAGVVQQVGSSVRDLEPGDHVVFSFLAACGRCRWCSRGQQNLCDLGAMVMRGTRPRDPKSFRMSLNGTPVAQMAGISTFSEYTLACMDSLVKVPKDVPLETVCLLGCAVGTGWGAAVNSAGVRVGDTVIVMGAGGVGINAVQGAVHAGARNVIAVDPVAFKREKAEEVGATHTFHNMDEATELARSFTEGQGADSAIVTVGVTTGEHVAQAFTAIRKGGTVVVSGVGDMKAIGAPVPLAELTLYQKRLQGSLFGACSPTVDIPRQLELYRAGMLKLDELITTRYTLDQVAQGYEDMHAGRNIRGVVVFE